MRGIVCGVLLEKHPCTPKTFMNGYWDRHIANPNGQNRCLNNIVFENNRL